MNYEQTLEQLYSMLPMYQRVGKAAYKANIDTTIALDNYFGNPHKKFKSIHIAGTNGKGSTAHSLSSIFQEAGYKTGLYTSPHYLDFRERIRINGTLISKEFVVDFYQKHADFFAKLKPSFFEITVAMAFEYFAQNEVDIAIVEVGMGGRLDSTNIINPLLSIITNIGFDHTQFLGDTLAKIAIEKAGIIKKDVPVIIGTTTPETRKVFADKAKEVQTSIYFCVDDCELESNACEDWNYSEYEINIKNKKQLKKLKFGLTGDYQKFNIPAIIYATELLKNKFSLSEENVRNGLKNVVKNTGIQGRWQTLSESHRIICDAGHNFDGIKNAVAQIKGLKYSRLHYVYGSVNDKDITKILELLPKDACYYFTKAQIPRSLDEITLSNKSKSIGLQGNTYCCVSEAIEAAIANYEKDDLIFIGGSTFIVAEAINYFKTKKNLISK